MIHDIDKQFFYNDVQVNLTKSNGDAYYRVELRDKYGYMTVVYEKTFNSVVEYTRKYYENTEKRKIKHDLETNAIEAMIKEDEARGTKLSLD